MTTKLSDTFKKWRDDNEDILDWHVHELNNLISTLTGLESKLENAQKLPEKWRNRKTNIVDFDPNDITHAIYGPSEDAIKCANELEDTVGKPPADDAESKEE